MRTRIAALSFAMLTLLCVDAPRPVQAGDAPDPVAAGRLTYGVAASFAPFEYQDGGQPAGFDIDFGAAVAARMGLVPAPLNMDFNGLIAALQGRRIDIINSAMYINPHRAAQVDFIPYMRLGEEILVRKGDPLNIRARDDLCGRRVAVTLGAIEETYAREDAANCKTAGRPELIVMTLPTAQDSALALRQRRAGAVFNSTPGAVVLITAMPDIYEVAGQPFVAGTQIGIAVRKGDTAMRAAVMQTVEAVVADGTYARLMQKYHLPPSGSLF